MTMSAPSLAKDDAIVDLRRRILPEAEGLDDRLRELARSTGPVEAFRHLISSKPFRKAYSDVFAGIGYDYPLGPIEYEVDAAGRAELLAHVKREWEKLGREDPHWSVLSDEVFRAEGIRRATARFDNSGVQETRRLIGGLKRQGIAPPFAVGVEYGCGLGRVSLPLSAHCGVLHAYDISEPHLRLAREAAAAKGVTNIEFGCVQDPAGALVQDYDLFYSTLVFQHNPPPVIVELIRAALSGLRKGGAAVFQVPVFRKNYRFVLEDYLAAEHAGIEMHCVPQRVVFELIEAAGCRLVDCFETSVSLRDRILSNIFTAIKA